MIIHYFLSRFAVGQLYGENLSPEGRICRQVFKIIFFLKEEKKRINYFIFPAKVGTQCLDDDDLEQHTRRRDHPVGENFDYNKRPPRYIL